MLSHRLVLPPRALLLWGRAASFAGRSPARHRLQATCHACQLLTWPDPLPSIPAVVPVLMQGMMELNRKRPADPIEFLCTFLQQHNPKKQQKTN